MFSLLQADVHHTVQQNVQIPQAHAQESKFYEKAENYKELPANSLQQKSDYVNLVAAHNNAGK